MPKRQSKVLLAIIGACFISQLAQLVKRPQYSGRLSLCYIAMIDKAYFTRDYSAIDMDNAITIMETNGQSPPSIPEIVQYLAAAPHKVIMVDNTSAQRLAESYPLFLSRGISIVTPNKKAFSGDLDIWQRIFKAAETGGSYVYHESSVGAGLPVVCTLKDLVATGDEVTRIEGVFSGTLSYLFNSFSPIAQINGAVEDNWSTQVAKAERLGFTEPDPRDDLNGLDVARKLTILARLAGLPITSPTSFPVESLIPKGLEGASSTQEFLEGLPQFDHEMKDRKIAAEKSGKVLRYTGSVDMATKTVKVALEEADRSSPIAQLKGSDNIIVFHTKRYGRLPLIVQGAGAGAEVTAMGVLGDLLRVLAQIMLPV
ncbi:homoserine dehydrogenase [Exophiala aquamarina CBS 119918]|uniref:Homoserine dehydrogenase n=1 Tax=Exophiala aquamarina CBS 119918 TaxID=1182545 RepID=A0A072NVZ2_9EURO|nr:homoserine dehydrogenase [Exophiala aquamarina CBS 119918]KEF52044.1 homoserine dehydrogenase [Exophiala aquamarina CBS 119918]